MSFKTYSPTGVTYPTFSYSKTTYSLPAQSYSKLTGRTDCPKCGGIVFSANYDDHEDQIEITCLACGFIVIEDALDHPSRTGATP